MTSTSSGSGDSILKKTKVSNWSMLKINNDKQVNVYNLLDDYKCNKKQVRVMSKISIL